MYRTPLITIVIFNSNHSIIVIIVNNNIGTATGAKPCLTHKPISITKHFKFLFTGIEILV